MSKPFTFKDFPAGMPVRINTKFQDFAFFNMLETGTVIENSGKYLGIIVKFDKEFKRPPWNFNPQDLLPMEKL
jgi:hypothetical protein